MIMNLRLIMRLELDALADEILSVSGLLRWKLDDAAIELSIGVELCCGGPDPDPDGELDPYDEFLAFARYPGLDYDNVAETVIAGLSRRQKFLAMAWHNAHLAVTILDGLDPSHVHDDAHDDLVYAQKLKLAARKLAEDSVGHDRFTSKRE